MIDNETLTVAGIPITVTRKQRQKNLYIRINPPEGDVTVSAPADATEDAIRYYVLRKVPEITKIRDRMVSSPDSQKGNMYPVRPAIYGASPICSRSFMRESGIE